MPTVLKIKAEGLTTGQQALLQVVGDVSRATESFVIADNQTEVTISLYAGRRLVVTEEPIPAATEQAATPMKEIGDKVDSNAAPAAGTAEQK
jgi:hypothetical protein